jgi:hypothetical protein
VQGNAEGDAKENISLFEIFENIINVPKGNTSMIKSRVGQYQQLLKPQGKFTICCLENSLSKFQLQVGCKAARIKTRVERYNVSDLRCVPLNSGLDSSSFITELWLKFWWQALGSVHKKYKQFFEIFGPSFPS